ncbi:MAG: hypothetical protein FWD46_00515 [Cystobacterineae bacterium]|nr:hypothetical protein [Cystobacterineae bacterium]
MTACRVGVLRVGSALKLSLCFRAAPISTPIPPATPEAPANTSAVFHERSCASLPKSESASRNLG